MARKRKIPGINGSSMADLSFVILMFFLLTSSMDTHRGLQRRLPPPLIDKQEPIEINERNLFIVRINSMNQLLAQGELIDVSQLREKVKHFVRNEFNEPHLPVLYEVVVEGLEHLGTLHITREHVISLQTDVDTQYQAYMDVQNELLAAYNELRDEFARARLGRAFNELPADLQRIIRRYVVPQNISEAEPRNLGGG